MNNPNADGPLGEIPLYATSCSLYSLIMEGARADHDVNAPYQRGSVWTETQQRNLIRSLLMRLPIGAIIRSTREVFTSANEAAFRVVDGRQRLEAIWAFTGNLLSVPAAWFPARDVLPEAVDSGQITWSGLTRAGQRHIENMPTAIIDLTSDYETVEVGPGNGSHGTLMQYERRTRSAQEAIRFEAMVYDLINSAGTSHTEADLERARTIANGGTPTATDTDASVDLAALGAATMRAHTKTHSTVSDEVWDTNPQCTCGQPWPCGVLAALIADA